MSVVLINGRAYDHTQIQIIYLGVPLPSVTTIDYGEEQDKANNFGTGNRPVSRGRSAIDSTGSIELSMNDIEAIRDAAPNGSLLQIPPADLLVVFINPQKPVTHTIKNLEWTTDKPSSSQGDTDIKANLDFVASNVKWR
jgi:hypothetical protein